MATVLTEFVAILIGAIKDLAMGIAEGVTAMAQALFLKTSEAGAVTGLSVFGGIIAIFAALGIATAVTTKVYVWVTTLGH